VVQQGGFVVAGLALLAVDSNTVEVSGSAEHTFLFPTHAGHDAVTMEDVPAFQLQGRPALQAYAADVLQVGVLGTFKDPPLLRRSRLHRLQINFV
jgi:hypothetical protein